MEVVEVLAMLKDEEKTLDVQAVIECVQGMADKISTLETHVSNLKEKLDARKAKLVDRIVGRLELLGKEPERFRTRSQTMDFVDLDAELEELEEQVRQTFGVARLTEPGDDLQRQAVSVSGDISQYRV